MNEQPSYRIRGGLPVWIGVLIVVGALSWVARVAWDLYDTESIPHVAVRYQLKFFGESIYEYHAKTGRWPQSVEAFAETKVGIMMPRWRETLPSLAFVWHSDLKSEPQANADAILLYHNGGLIAEMGRKWVCFGDLRTEYVTTDRLKELLAKQGK